MRRRIATIVLAAGAASLVPTAHGAQRLSRLVGADAGVHAANAVSLARDEKGYLWLGTYMGLARYDGHALVPWAPEVIEGEVRAVAATHDEVFAANDAGLFSITDRDARRISGPEGKLEPPDQLVANDAGLWAKLDGEVWRRDSAGAWSAPLRDALGEEAPLSLMLAGRELFVSTPTRLLRVTDGRVTTYAVGWVVGVTVDAEALAVITARGRVLSLDSTGSRELYARRDRGNALLRRGDAIWALFDTALVRLGPDGAIDATDASSGTLLPGRPAVLDGESSLWSVTFRGLHQLPEPETVYYGAADGLPSSHTRYVAPGPDGALYVSTWQPGVGRLVPTEQGWVGHTDAEHTVKGNFCPDGEGALWSVGPGEVLRWTEQGLKVWSRQGKGPVGRCTTDATGTVWIATARGVVDTREVLQNDSVVEIAGPSDRDLMSYAWAEGASLFAAVGESICTTGRPAASATRVDWQCRTLQDVGSITSVATFSTMGEVVTWVGTSRGGVLQRDPSGWRPVSLPALPSPRIDGLVPSPRGGVWIASPGALVRLELDAGSWSEVERLGLWHGLLEVGATSLHEEEDGTLWIATADGVARMPPSARFTAPVLPRWGQLEVDGPAQDGETFVVSDRTVRLRFSALALRDPHLLRRRMQRDDEEWTELGPDASVHLVGLSPGRHTVRFEVSYDGVTWAGAPPLTIDVRRPWWQAPVPWLLLILAALAAVTGWTRGRALTSPAVRVKPASVR